jgi:rare lipoprotein A
MQPDDLPVRQLVLCLLLLLAVTTCCHAQECTETGMASYYAKRLEGRTTASGLPYHGELYTAAHRSLPFGTLLLVKNPDTGKSVVVVVTDRGPFVRGRVVDLSLAAARELDIIRRGLGQVEIYCLPKILPLLTRKEIDNGLLNRILLPPDRQKALLADK